MNEGALGGRSQAKMFKPRAVKDSEELTFHLDLTRAHLFDATTLKSPR